MRKMPDTEFHLQHSSSLSSLHKASDIGDTPVTRLQSALSDGSQCCSRRSDDTSDTGDTPVTRLQSALSDGSQGCSRRSDDSMFQNVNSDSRYSANVKRKSKKNKPVTINVSGTRYDIVKCMAIEAGYTLSKDEDMHAFVLWNDAFVSTDRIFDLKPFQRINHFPGMGEVTRKDSLARNITKMQKIHQEEFNFIPRTWILPADYNHMINYGKDLKNKKKVRTFIAKPPNASQGHGISLYRNVERIPANEPFIVQEYIDKPLLIEGYKFDLRIYVLITSCDPLRLFLFNDGLVRLGTEKYIPPHETNINNLFMHLTNYSINKHNDNYERGISIETGSKRSFKFFNDYLRKHDFDVVLLWKNITDVIIRTFIIAEPHVMHAYRMSRPGAPPASDSVCFEILGLDIIIDRHLRPWLLEINRSPSFGTDEEIDYNVKSALLFDTFKLLNIRISDRRRNIAAEKAQAQKRLFRPTKRMVTQDASDRVLLERKHNLEKRKDELKELLEKVKKASSREDFENRNIGRFRRIFPTEDKHRQEKYTKLLLSSFNVFLSGRVGGIEKEIQHLYSSKLREQDILDLLAECDSDIYDVNPVGKLTRPLSSMPVATPSHQVMEDSNSDEKNESFYDVLSCWKNLHHPITYSAKVAMRRESMSPFMTSNSSCANSNVLKPLPVPRSESWNQAMSEPSSTEGKNKTSDVQTYATSEPSLSIGNMSNSNVLVNMPEEDVLINRTLHALNEMSIKFPGKTDHEAEMILDNLRESWRYHKPRIASYWLVKLDSIKRRKVIDIVRSNVKVVVQRIWRLPDIESLRLYRMFNKVFSRLLWSHGQGLWNCFSQSGNSTWEVIFSKSTDRLRNNEMNCCRRITQLCQDCLLIVYQFAEEASLIKRNSNDNSSDNGRCRYGGQKNHFRNNSNLSLTSPHSCYGRERTDIYSP